MSDARSETKAVAEMLREVAMELDSVAKLNEDIVQWETWEVLVGMMIRLKQMNYSIDSLVEDAEDAEDDE